MSEIWQYPHVDVFKSFNLWDWKNSKKTGEVIEELDSTIGRKVLHIEGSIPVNNNVVLPGPRAEMRSLALKGRYLYLAVSSVDDKPFVVHFDFTFAEGRGVRLSLSNLYREAKFDQLAIHVPARLLANRWSILCLDLKGYFIKYHCLKHEKEPHFLKTITICSTIKISQIVTSDKLYDCDSFPKNLNFKHSLKLQWRDLFSWIEPVPLEHPPLKEIPKQEVKKVDLRKKCPKKPELPDKTPIEQLQEEAKFTMIKAKSEETKAKLLQKIMGKENQIQGEMSDIKNSDSLRSSHSKLLKMTKDNLLQIRNVIGSTVCSCPTICWSQNKDSKEIVYASGSLLVIMEVDSETQRVLKGHSKAIKTMCVSANGEFIASADEDSIRVWEFSSGRCLGIWTVDSHKKLNLLSFSSSGKLLASVGKDVHERDVITVWNLSTMDKITSYHPQPDIAARQISPFEINYLKFAPDPSPLPDNYEPQLCSCGKENIRFWILKKNSLKGKGVVLNNYAKETMFTTLDYEGPQRVFVGSSQGMIFQVNAETEELEFVYQLHEYGIRTLSVCGSFCVTGSDDLFLRVWPLDFAEYFMEAKHEAAIQNLAISPDNLEILCATECGTVGILDIPNQKYKIIIRSHTDSIIACDTRENYLVSISLDKTIRVWDIHTTAQLYEFASLEDQAICVAIHPTKQLFVCGFHSGTLRIFDLNTTSVIDEFRLSEKPLLILRYLPTTNILIVQDEEGSLSFFNSIKHEIIKNIALDFPTQYVGLSVTKSEKIMATIGAQSTCIDVWDMNSFSKALSIPITGCRIRDVVIRSSHLQVLALTTDSLLRVFSLDGKPLAKFVLESLNTGPFCSLAKMAISANSKYLAIYGPDNGIRQIQLPNIQGFSLNTSQLLPQQTLDIEEYFFHQAPVQVALYHSDPTLFITAAGQEGIYLWTFQGDTSPAAEEEMLGTFELSAKKQIVPETKSITLTLKAKKVEIEKRQENVIEEVEEEPGIRASAVFATPLEAEEEKASLEVHQSINLQNILKKKELNLPQKQYLNQSAEVQFSKLMKDSELSPELVIGYNGNAHDNIFWHEKEGWILYTIKNKIIIESVCDRKQEIYADLDTEISCLCVSSDKQYLAIGAGHPSPITKKCDIVLYLINPKSNPKLTLMRHFCLQEEGTQSLVFVGAYSYHPNKYLVSASKYPENMLTVWDIEQGAMVSTNKLDHPINHLLNDMERGFMLVSGNEIEECRIKGDAKSRVESSVFSSVDYTGIFTCMAKTRLIKSEDSYLILIGTVDGRVLIYNPKRKTFVGDYPLFESQISNIYVGSEYIIVSGEAQTVMRWKLPDIALIHPNLFVSSPETLYVDSSVVAIAFDEAGNEGQVGTGDGTLYYLNFSENLVIKYQTGHLNSNISTLFSTGPGLISAATDQTIKLWSLQNCDPEIELEIPGALCTVLTHRAEIGLAGYEDGSIRFIQLSTLKNLGRLNITTSKISALSLSPIKGSAFIGDTVGNVFLLSIESLAPLTAKSQKLISHESEITSLDIQGLAPGTKFALTLKSGKVIVYEKSHKTLPLSSCPDPFNLSRDWNFLEADCFDLAEAPGLASVRFSPSSANHIICAINTLKTLIIRDITRHQIINSFELHQFPLCFDVKPEIIVVGGTEGLIEKIEISGKKSIVARAHANPVESICFTTNSIISGSQGEIIKWKCQSFLDSH